MTAKYSSTKKIDNAHQKGFDINVELEGNTTTFSAWCDIMDKDNPTIRVSVNHGAEHLILVSVEQEDFKTPEVTYSEDKKYCYITFKNNSLHIKLDDEGIVFDVWDKTDDENGSIDTNYVLYQEFELYEDFR